MLPRVLRFNEGHSAFVLATEDKPLAEQVMKDGWARDTAYKGSGFALITREPYAAVHHIGAARDDVTRNRLAPLAESYASSLAEVADNRYPSPPGMTPLPFQIAGINYALSRAHPLIGDEMGLCKTSTSIMMANEMQAERVLVVCPASVRLQWQKEVRAWSTLKKLWTYPILKSADGVSPFANWTFVSYDLMRHEQIHAALSKLRFDMLVLDECHYLKTSDSGRTRACFGDLAGKFEGIASRAERVVGLTGTPLPNRPREAYTLARHMCWEAIDWLSEQGFERRFNPSAKLWTGKILEEVGRMPELRARLRCNFMVRRLKKKVLKQLPEQQYELTYIEPNGAIRKVLKAESLLGVDIDRLDDMDMVTRGHIATVRREMGVAKVPRIVEHVSMLIEGGLPKVVVAAFHREVMTTLAEKFSRFGCAIITGGQTPMQREREKARFIHDPNCRILLGQLLAAGEGVDGLQKVCAHGVFAEADWTPKTNDQFAARLWRMGQSRGVLWQFLVAPGSLDERILGRAIGKAHNIHKTLDGE